MGIDDIYNTYAVYDSNTNSYPNVSEFLNTFRKCIKTVESLPYNKQIKIIYTNYSGNNTINNSSQLSDTGSPFSPYTYYLLNDGSSISFKINSGMISFVIDTNGPYKKPNRYGYDLFMFVVKDSSNKLEPMKQIKLYTEEELEGNSISYLKGWPCSERSKQEYNGTGCAYYAMINKNPDDPTKGYWESLK